MLRLISFGPPRISDGSGDAISIPGKALLALAYIKTRPSCTVTRAELADFLWDEAEAVKPLANLRQLLLRIKNKQTASGIRLFSSTKHSVSIDPNQIQCDTDLLYTSLGNSAIDSLTSFLFIVRGAYLEGLSASSRAGDAWLEAERGKYVSLLVELIARAMRAVDLHEHGELLEQAARRLVLLDWSNETAYQVLTEVLVHKRKPYEAIKILEDFKDRLRSEFQATPESATERLIKGLRLAPKMETAHHGLDRPEWILPRVAVLAPEESVRTDCNIASAFLEDIQLGLCRARDLRVIGTHTARRINPDERLLAYQIYNIDYAVQTRAAAAFQSGSWIVELIDTQHNEVVWADRFDLSLQHLTSAYNAIVSRTVRAIVREIEELSISRINQHASADAYQNYLLGSRYMAMLDLPSVRRARKHFTLSAKESPYFANAWSGVARTEHLEWILTARGDGELLSSAETHAKLAISLDPDDACGYRELGAVRKLQGIFDESINVFRDAEAYTPSHADLLADYADSLVHASRPEEALQKIDQAIDLNPHAPDVYWWISAGANFFSERYGEAVASIEKMQDWTPAARLGAAANAMLGNTRSAQRLMQVTLEEIPDFTVDNWLSVLPDNDPSQIAHYREGLKRAGFK